MMNAHLFQLVISITVTTALIPSSSHYTFLLCRHGDSIWNGGSDVGPERFTGWTDVPLSPKGFEEARQASQSLESYVGDIDVVFTSTLLRAKQTARECLKSLKKKRKSSKTQSSLELLMDYRLNERHYGDLQGLIKEDVEEGKYGHDARDVRDWRRSWFVRPPPMASKNDRRMRSEIRKHGTCPNGESLEMVAQQRVRPYLYNVMLPVLQKTASKTGLVVAHANSLRALIGILCDVQNDPVALGVLEELKLPTGVPLVFHVDSDKLRPLDLPDPEECLVQELNGLIHLAQKSPPDLGHPSLPIWPLNTCIPVTSSEAAASTTATKTVNRADAKIWRGYRP